MNDLKKILIVDDSKFICIIVKDELIKSGAEESSIFIAESYKEAQVLVFEHDFHVAILDINLPDAQNGEIIDLLIEENVPVLVLTAGMSEINKKIILNKNIVDYVTKSNPQSIYFLVDIVNRILKNYDINILVLDESKTARAIISNDLEHLHINVLEAKSAQEAIEIIENGDELISLVLTDYEMFDMNGMELTMYLRQRYSKDKLSIIAMSENDDMEIATNFLRYGANDFIKKPFSKEEFSCRVNNLIEALENLNIIHNYEIKFDDIY